MEELLLQMHERAGDLDQALEKADGRRLCVCSQRCLEHVVRFVVLLRIEAGEIALVARIERQPGIGAELLRRRRRCGRFFSSRGCRGETILPASCA